MQPEKQLVSARGDQLGGSRFNFLIVAVIILAAAYAGFQYIPAAYQAYQFQDLMQQAVDRASALGQSPEDVRKLLVIQGKDFGVPPDALIKAEPKDGRIEATVQYVRPIALPGYTYQYTFDHTVKSASMFNPK